MRSEFYSHELAPPLFLVDGDIDDDLPIVIAELSGDSVSLGNYSYDDGRWLLQARGDEEGVVTITAAGLERLAVAIRERAPVAARGEHARDLEAERAARNEEPRPGVWAGEDGADLRALTQEQTDWLIRHELHQATQPTDSTRTWPLQLEHRNAHRQRGGIDSHPLVRLLAWRVFGERDRRWFELRGVRKGDRLSSSTAMTSRLGTVRRRCRGRGPARMSSESPSMTRGQARP